MFNPILQFNIFADKIIKFYKYRTAKLSNWAIKINLSDDDIEEIRDILEASNYHLDNHIVFATANGNFWFSDRTLYIGGTIKEEVY